MTNAVSLQISFAPPDMRHSVLVLPHQLRMLATQVDEVVLVLDTEKRQSKRFDAGWHDALASIRSLLNSIASDWDNVRVLEVDYRSETVDGVSRRFFDRPSIPAKDLRGGAFYAYFFGLAAAAHDHVFHLDSDVLLGGGSPSWVSEAIVALETRREVVCVCPLSGPPAPDGLLRDQDAYAPVRERPFRFRFRDFTSRVFLGDRTRLALPDQPIRLSHGVPWWARTRGLISRRSTFELPERLISLMMRERGLVRVDLLGDVPGLWTVHPVNRCQRFIEALPDIIARVECGEVTEPQLGRYDLHPSMIVHGDGR
jgi:hypothetical protein